MRGLIGFSGFVGQHLIEQTSFDKVYRSSTVGSIKDQTFELLVCAGVPAVKWLANQEPENDLHSLRKLLEHLKTTKANEFVLISTIDVYPDPATAETENAELRDRRNHAYGTHRFWFEQQVKSIFPVCTIVRLPALFGRYMKKNYIFDLLHEREEFIRKIHLQSAFQWYNVERLWSDICTVRAAKAGLVNLFTEPVKTETLVRDCFPRFLPSCEEIANLPLRPMVYNLQTKFSSLWGSASGYIQSADDVLSEIRDFVRGFRLQPALDKLCISNIAWDEGTNGAVLEFLKFKRIKSLEVAPTKVIHSWKDLEEVTAARELMQHYGDFKILSLQSILFGTSDLEIFGSSGAREALMRHSKHVVNLAASVGAKFIVWGSPKQRSTHGQSYSSCFDIAVTFFKHLGKYSYERDVIIVFEPNAKEYGCDFCYNATQAATLVRAVETRGFRLHLDTANMHLAGDDIADTIMKNADILAHVQISEPFLGNFHSPNVNHAEVSRLLCQVGYKGHVSIEMRSTTDTLRSIACAIRQTIQSYHGFLQRSS